MNDRQRSVAVIIPYYQRTPGILARAVNSVFAQQVSTPTRFEIVIVDDESPSPPEADLDGLSRPDHVTIRLISQANGGPGAARNSGLDAIQGEPFDAVAFLDSDDEWLPDHIETALRALSSGASFYFCDHTRGEEPKSWLEASDFYARWSSGTLGWAPEPISESGQLYRMEPNQAFALFWKEYLSQTSTIVLIPSALGKTRFKPELKFAGEDQYLWLQMARSGTGVAFSTNKNVLCGDGVNVYFSAFDWTLPKTADRMAYLYLFSHALLTDFPVSKEMKNLVVRRQNRFLRTYSFLTLKHITKGILPRGAILALLWKASPANLVLMPFHAISAIIAGNKRGLEW